LLLVWYQKYAINRKTVHLSAGQGPFCTFDYGMLLLQNSC
jgi:hypothetical protein